MEFVPCQSCPHSAAVVAEITLHCHPAEPRCTAWQDECMNMPVGVAAREIGRMKDQHDGKAHRLDEMRPYPGSRHLVWVMQVRTVTEADGHLDEGEHLV